MSFDRDSSVLSLRLEDLPSLVAPRGRRAIVWTPARETRLASVHVPTRDPRKLKLALPFALEDSLLEPVDRLHFAAAAFTGGSSADALSVGVTSRDLVRGWLRRFSECGLEAVAICPVTLGIPWDGEGTAAFAFLPDGGCARVGLLEGFACSSLAGANGSATVPVELAAWMRSARENGSGPSRLMVYGAPAGFDAQKWREELRLAVELCSDIPLASSAPLNLLQGEFAPAATWKKAVGAWRPFLFLAAVWAVGSFVVNAWDAVRLGREERGLHQQMTQLFHGAFPDVKTIIDPALQMERNLQAFKTRAGGLADDDLLVQLSALAPAVAAAPGVSLRNLRYDEGRLTVTLALPDLRSLEKLKKACAEFHVPLDVASAESRAGSVEARLVLSGVHP